MGQVTRSRAVPARGNQPVITTTAATSGGVPALRVFADSVERAYLTTGSRTVTVQGPARTFTENKKVGLAYKDDFTRTVTTGFGISPFYGSWSHNSGGADSDFAVNGSAGTCNPKVTNVAHIQTLRDDVLAADAEVLFRITNAPAGATNSFSLLTEYTTSSAHNRARVTFNTTGTITVVMSNVVSGAETVVGTATNVITGHTPGTWLRLRHTWSGTTRNITIWNDGNLQPGTPTLSFTDATYAATAGRVGFRFFNSTSTTNNQTYEVSDLIIRAGNWSAPPAITHSTWVRVLAAPYTTWNAAVEAQVRGWLSDDSYDALALGMNYLYGACAIADPRLQEVGVSATKQVFGEARYGPTETDGKRQEGSDFNDYIRIPWVYLNTATPSTDVNELAQQYCLDCSGYMRMIWGYHLGLPMSLDDSADYNGLNLPRRSVGIGPSGPGTLIASSTGTAVSLTDLRIGDIIAFNADAADDTAAEETGDVEQTDDHVGMYLGLDQGGNKIFLSSRKTANGPTFGPVGGASYLNGSGFWATAARHIRRF
jgi:hypothetical protein